MRRLAVLLILFSLFATLSMAQMNESNAGGPPKYLQINREEVKAGKVAAHDKLEAAWTAGVKKAGLKTPYLGVSSVTGPTEAIWFSPYDSLAALQKQMQEEETNAALRAVSERFSAQDADFVTRYSTMIAVRRDDLSYKLNFNIGEYKYLTIANLRTKLGHGNDALESTKLFNAARDKANIDVHVAAYEVISGAPAGTYLYFTPRKSLAEMDESDAMKRFNEAIGEKSWRRLTEIADNGGFTLENRIFAINPAYSNAAPEVAAANPSFWNPKPVVAKARAARKTTGETSKK